MSDKELLYEVKDRVAWITLNRESRRNALSLGMVDLFFDYLDQAETDERIRVVCLTGAGEKAFCSGADLSSTFQAGDYKDGAKKFAALLNRMASFTKPIVARVNGHCMAGGMGFMLSCDIVYAREGAKFGTPEVNVGLFPMMIGALIFRNATRKKALEMIYTARTLGAQEAEEMGLITRCVPPEELDNIVNKTLEDISAKAPLAVEMGRKALAAVEDWSLNDALDYLSEQLCEVVATDDAKEGLMAFMQKREPEWKRK
jgi:enoyl-CoA hydratase/carnithine racemase